MTASKILSAAMLAIGLTGSAFGLTITSATVAAASGNGSQPDSASEVKTALGLSYNLSELYWADDDNDGGTFDPSYSSNFFNGDTDVKIDNTNTPAISGYNSLFLVALGETAANPDWKIFNITGWNGTDDINLDSVFPSKDTKKVYVYGGNAPQQPNNGVPDSGSTAVLLGSALLGLAIYSRRKSA